MKYELSVLMFDVVDLTRDLDSGRLSRAEFLDEFKKLQDEFLEVFGPKPPESSGGAEE